MKLILAATFTLLAAPVFAADPTTMTCTDMMAMDSQGMADTGVAIKGAMTDNTKMSAMADADVTTMASDACTAHPDATVMDAMHMAMLDTMTCTDVLAMDDTVKMNVVTGMKMAMKDDTTISAMADADLKTKLGDVCTSHPDATVMDAMKM
ncbi:MAG: HdeA/HdeB family chaperone [bacterium]